MLKQCELSYTRTKHELLGERAMEQRIIALGLRIRKWSFFRIIQRTFAVLFPFILLGSFARVIEFSLLHPDGYLGNLILIDKWLPHYRAANQLFGSVYMLTAGVIALLAAGTSAKYTARFFKRDEQLASLTGFLVFLAICYQRSLGNSSQFNFRLDLLGFSGLILGLAVGYGVGLVFKYLSKQTNKKAEHGQELLARSFKSLLPLTVALLFAVVCNILLGLLFKYQIFEGAGSWLQSQATKQSGFWAVMFFASITLLLSWLGLSGPYTNNTFDSDQSALKNLSYALSHNELAKVPEKFNANTLYFSYGALGGTGATLGLILAIFLVAKRQNTRKLASWTVLPSMFNTNAAFMIGLPLLFNPFYLLPFLVIPLFNMVIGALALLSGLVPPAVYPVLMTTPGVLYAFIGTNGSWGVLIFTFGLLLCDILLYLPFVRFAEKIAGALDNERKRAGEVDADQ